MINVESTCRSKAKNTQKSLSQVAIVVMIIMTNELLRCSRFLPFVGSGEIDL